MKVPIFKYYFGRKSDGTTFNTLPGGGKKRYLTHQIHIKSWDLILSSNEQN